MIYAALLRATEKIVEGGLYPGAYSPTPLHESAQLTGVGQKPFFYFVLKRAHIKADLLGGGAVLTRRQPV